MTFMGHNVNIINVVPMFLLAIILVYIFTRVISTAFFVSWWNVKDWRWRKRLKHHNKEEDKDASRS